MHLILQGSAVFYGPRGEERHCGLYEGVMLPKGCFYRFQATSEEPLVMTVEMVEVPLCPWVTEMLVGLALIEVP